MASSGPIEWVLDCSVFRSKEKLQNPDFPWPCSTGAFSWTKRRTIKATALEATHSAVGVTSEPIWRSLVPTQRSQFSPEDRNWFTWREVLVKVSFGERGSTFGIFQKELRENAYCYCYSSTSYFSWSNSCDSNRNKWLNAKRGHSPQVQNMGLSIITKYYRADE